jgi:catechol 2,3-dioxygenase-like lactoylglutathione lyase family enzyme
MHIQPFIAVRDVRASSRWYQSLLGAKSAMGDEEHEHRNVVDMLARNGEICLQLHAWDEENHPNLTQPEAGPNGHGVLLWFQVTDSEFDECVTQAAALQAEMLEEPHENEYDSREFWIRDPDGYVIVFSTFALVPA